MSSSRRRAGSPSAPIQSILLASALVVTAAAAFQPRDAIRILPDSLPPRRTGRVPSQCPHLHLPSSLLPSPSILLSSSGINSNPGKRRTNAIARDSTVDVEVELEPSVSTTVEAVAGAQSAADLVQEIDSAGAARSAPPSNPSYSLDDSYPSDSESDGLLQRIGLPEYFPILASVTHIRSEERRALQK